MHAAPPASPQALFTRRISPAAPTPTPTCLRMHAHLDDQLVQSHARAQRSLPLRRSAATTQCAAVLTVAAVLTHSGRSCGRGGFSRVVGSKRRSRALAATCRHHTAESGCGPLRHALHANMAAGGQVGVLQQVQPLQPMPQITPQQLQAMMASGQSPQITSQQLQTITAGYTPQMQAPLMQQLQSRSAQPRPPPPGAAAQPRPQVQLAHPCDHV